MRIGGFWRSPQQEVADQFDGLLDRWSFARSITGMVGRSSLSLKKSVLDDCGGSGLLSWPVGIAFCSSAPQWGHPAEGEAG
jgi:hypothetical protein